MTFSHILKVLQIPCHPRVQIPCRKELYLELLHRQKSHHSMTLCFTTNRLEIIIITVSVVGPVLSSLELSSHSILTISLRSRSYYHPHFKGRKLIRTKLKQFVQGHMASKCRSPDLNSDLPDPRPSISSTAPPSCPYGTTAKTYTPLERKCTWASSLGVARQSTVFHRIIIVP